MEPGTTDNSNKILTVSRLTQQLQGMLRDRFFDVRVSGEISNLTRPASGHVYLTLGDEKAQMKAVIWRSDAEQVGFELENGQQVICQGEVDIYPPRGVYQLIIRQIEPSGLGSQQLALKQLHARLAAEGLFDPQRKKPLPSIPRRIAVVTSPTGAAIQDFLKVVTRRWPDMEVLVIPARVQGEGAALEVAQGVVVAGHLKFRPDVLVVTRGGGSAEDLWAFNDERLVRTIANCEIPVISGVGHEIDVTLTDLVADVRALTPSEAGELVVPVKEQWTKKLDEMKLRMRLNLAKRISVARDRLSNLATRRVLREPDHLLHTARRSVDEIEFRLAASMNRVQDREQGKIALLAARLQAISPLRVLARGYSVTETEQGETITSVDGLSVGQTIRTRLATGTVESRIHKINRHANLVETTDTRDETAG